MLAPKPSPSPPSTAGKWLAIIVAKTLLCGALSFSYFSVSDVTGTGNATAVAIVVAVKEKLVQVTLVFSTSPKFEILRRAASN